jgi:autotransporter-associated beta strand protein
MSINGGALVTNEANAEIDVDTGSSGGNWVASGGCVIANYGTIKEVRGRLNLAPTGAPFDGATLFGPGQFLDSDGGLITGNDGRLAINPSALWSPGTNLYNSIGTTFVQARVDLNNTPASGVGVLRIEVDFNNPQTNDIVIADKWNNITGMLLMTNINPGAGSFAPGQVFQVFSNTASSPGFPFPNFIDVNGTYPIMSPVVPGPGLQWGLLDFRTYGTVSVTNSPLVWDGGINGNWDTNTANWKSGNIYSDGQGAMLDDSASGTTTITLTNIIAPIGFILVTNIVPNVSTNVITNNPVMSPGLVVSNSAKDYTISGSGKISGMTGLYKIGSGALNLLNTTNDFTGNVIINGGTVAVSNPPAPSATIASLGINGSGGINNEIFIDGGTLKYIGLTNAALSRSMSIGSGGATLNVNSATNELTAGTIWGAGGLTKIGPGTVVLTANANTFAGGIAINSGTVRMTSAAAGSGTISVGANTSLVLTNTYNFTNAMNIAGAGTTILLYANTNVSGGAWSGAGTTTVSGTNTGQLIVNASMAGLSGVVSLGSSANSIRFNNSTNSNPNTGSTAGTYDLGTGSGALWNLNGNGLTYNLGALSGGPNTILFGSSTNMGVPACTYSIGANGSNTVFSGRITNGVGAVTVAKVGSGSLGLAGNNTYSGGTLVNGGTLLVNNTAGSGTGSGSVSVGSGATLGGNGAIGGAVSVASGGTLSPGTSIGRLTINNSLSLAGTTFIEVSKNGSALTNDNVAGLTSVSFGGALVVTNLGPTALAAGDSFQLFNIGGPGNFTSLTPALASPLAWSFNPVNGVLSVIDIRPVLTFSRSGNTVQLNWTGASKLQAQTNGITGPWFDYPGGAAGPVTVTIDPNQTDVFFRLAPSP